MHWPNGAAALRGRRAGAVTTRAGAARHSRSSSAGWQLIEDGKAIWREFAFRDFYRTMSFVNALAHIANHRGPSSRPAGRLQLLPRALLDPCHRRPERERLDLRRQDRSARRRVARRRGSDGPRQTRQLTADAERLARKQPLERGAAIDDRQSLVEQRTTAGRLRRAKPALKCSHRRVHESDCGCGAAARSAAADAARPDPRAARRRGRHRLAQCGRIEQAQIRPLAGKRMDHVRGIADQRAARARHRYRRWRCCNGKLARSLASRVAPSTCAEAASSRCSNSRADRRISSPRQRRVQRPDQTSCCRRTAAAMPADRCAGIAARR